VVALHTPPPAEDDEEAASDDEARRPRSPAAPAFARAHAPLGPAQAASAAQAAAASALAAVAALAGALAGAPDAASAPDTLAQTLALLHDGLLLTAAAPMPLQARSHSALAARRAPRGR
jgi:hypothetical protein